MKKSLLELLSKCYDNDLQFDYTPHIGGLVDVTRWQEDAPRRVTSGFTAGPEYKHGKPEEVIARMHKDVDWFLRKEAIENGIVDEHQTEYARAELTENERKMREAGMKESDFR